MIIGEIAATYDRKQGGTSIFVFSFHIGVFFPISNDIYVDAEIQNQS